MKIISRVIHFFTELKKLNQNMKTFKAKITAVAAAVLFTLLLVSLNPGCSSDPQSGNFIIGTPLFGGYDRNEAGVNMTLSAICYTAENNPSVPAIRDSIILQLADTSYATKGKWKLAWGPGVSLSRGNLMYVAVDSTADTIYYAIAVRGTSWQFPANIQQDMLVWNLMKYPFGSGSGDSVAEGSLYGLDTLLQTSDPESGMSLQAFLNTFIGGHQKMFITGHSLGGRLQLYFPRGLLTRVIHPNSALKLILSPRHLWGTWHLPRGITILCLTPEPRAIGFLTEKTSFRTGGQTYRR